MPSVHQRDHQSNQLAPWNKFHHYLKELNNEIKIDAFLKKI